MTLCFPLPSNQEEDIGSSGAGADWKEIKERYLPLLGLEPDEVNITHVLRCRPRARKGDGTWYSYLSEDFFKTKVARQAMEHCKVHDKEMEGEELKVVMGELGHVKYGGPGATDSQFNWRGHLAPED